MALACAVHGAVGALAEQNLYAVLVDLLQHIAAILINILKRRLDNLGLNHLCPDAIHPWRPCDDELGLANLALELRAAAAHLSAAL
eukprot:86064-Prymnesium_polylepis.2